MRVTVINGPNLNLIGTREPDVYGSTTIADLEDRITSWAGKLGMEAELVQSNDEAVIVDALHAATDHDGVVLNPGALTHTSRAVADAVSSITAPVVEVHISNVHAREPWRQVSVLDGVAYRSIFGRGITGYRDALRLLRNVATSPPETIVYGPHPENVADVRLSGSPSSLVVLVHGGFWLRQYGRDIIDGLAVDLAGRGLATVNLEYRRSNAGGAWPGSAHDLAMGIDYLGRRFGDVPIALVGHSAGGYLALWAAERAHPSLTVALAPVTDLTAMAAGAGTGAVACQELLSAGAPRTVDGAGPRLVVHGAVDDLVPVSQSTRVGDAEIEVVADLGHFELLDPHRPHWPAVVTALEGAPG